MDGDKAAMCTGEEVGAHQAACVRATAAPCADAEGEVLMVAICCGT